LKFAGKGFMDSSRIASGPANIWADVLMTNKENISRGIDLLTAELAKLKKAIRSANRKKIERLLDSARQKRSTLVKYKMNRKELI
jgi:prephenate dehydrogenase